jgi:hypothetical protein
VSFPLLGMLRVKGVLSASSFCDSPCSMYDDVVLSMRGEEWNSGFPRPLRKKTSRLLFNLFVAGS